MAKMMQPLLDYVLIKPIEKEITTPTGIILPDSAKEKPQTGEVMAVGPGKYSPDSGKLIPMSVTAGQIVLYKKWSVNDVKVEGKDWVLVEQKDILAIYEKSMGEEGKK